MKEGRQVVEITLTTGSNNTVTRAWWFPCDCGAMLELTPCAPENDCWEAIGCHVDCPADEYGINYVIGGSMIDDWDEWETYWKSHVR